LNIKLQHEISSFSTTINLDIKLCFSLLLLLDIILHLLLCSFCFLFEQIALLLNLFLGCLTQTELCRVGDGRPDIRAFQPIA